jgi:hypothetical protein
MIEREPTQSAVANSGRRLSLARRPATRRPLALAVVVALLVAASAEAQDDAEEIATLRAAIVELKADYEQRIGELERRLARAEQAAAATAPSRAAGRTVATPEGGSVTTGNAFNPQVSVILDGGYYHDEVGGDAYTLLGEAAQPSHPSHGEEDHAHERSPSRTASTCARRSSHSARRSIPISMQPCTLRSNRAVRSSSRKPGSRPAVSRRGSGSRPENS